MPNDNLAAARAKSAAQRKQRAPSKATLERYAREARAREATEEAAAREARAAAAAGEGGEAGLGQTRTPNTGTGRRTLVWQSDTSLSS